MLVLGRVIFLFGIQSRLKAGRIWPADKVVLNGLDANHLEMVKEAMSQNFTHPCMHTQIISNKLYTQMIWLSTVGSYEGAESH